MRRGASIRKDLADAGCARSFGSVPEVIAQTIIGAKTRQRADFTTCASPRTMTDVESIKRRIAELQLEHRGLDSMIEAVGQQTRFDELQLRRLKKRKLQIKDAIALLQMQLIPDVPA